MSRRAIWGAALLVAATPVLGRQLPKSQPAEAARPCPESGEGFVRLAGSDTCVKLGGSVRVEVMKQGGGAAFGER